MDGSRARSTKGRPWRRLSPVANSTIGSIASVLAGQGALLVSGILAARVLGPENRGHLALLALVPVVVCQVGMLGVGNAVTYYIARDRRATAAIVRTTMVLALVQLILCSVLNAFVMWLLVRDESHVVQVAAWLTVFVPPTIVVRTYALAILQGMREFGSFNLLRNVQPYLYAAGLVALLVIDESSLDVVAAVWSATSVVAAALAVIAVARVLPATEPGGVVPASGDLVRFGAKGFLGAVSPIETFRLDQAVVGLFLSPVALGIYVASLAFTNLPRFVAQSIGIVAFPHIAGQPNDQLARRSMWRFFWLTLGGSVAIVLVLGAAAPTLIPLAFGEDFQDAVVPMQILLLSSVALGARRVLGDAMRGRGFPAASTWAEVASWIWLLPALAIFGSWGELEGVAIAIASSSAVSLLVLLWFILHGQNALQPAQQVRVRGTLRASLSFAPRLRKEAVLITAASLALATAVGVTLALVAPSIDVVLLVALGAVLVAPLVIRGLTRRFDPFEPIVIYTIAFGVMFLVRPAAMIINDDFLYYRPSRILDARAGFTEMLVLALIGAVGFWVGYELPLGRRLAQKLAPPPERYHVDTVVSGAMALSIIGIVVFGLFLFQSGRWASPSQLLKGRDAATDSGIGGYVFSGLLLLIPASLILFVLGRAHRNILLTLLSSVAFVVVLLRAVPTGSRFTLFTFLGGLLVYHYVSRMTRPRVVTVLAIGVAILFASMLLAETRTTSVRQEEGVNQIIARNLKNPLDALSRLTETGGDASMAPGVAALLPMIPEEIPYEYGRAIIGDIVVRPIPRAIWPEKPVTSREMIAQTVWPDEYAANIIRLELSLLFHFYLDWGVVGVAFGMAVVGTLARGLYEYFLRHASNQVAQLMFGVCLTYMVAGMRDSPVGTLVHMSFTVLPIWLLFHVAAIKPRPALQLQRQFS